MNLKRMNESFRKLSENVLTESATKDELRSELEYALMDLQMRQQTHIKAYEIAFQEVLEKLFPDKAWWEVCSLNIFEHLFTERDPSATVEAIINNMKIELPVEEELNEAPEIKSCPVCGRGFAESELEDSRCPRCSEILIKTDSGEYVKEESLNEDMDAFYGSLCKEMDVDNERMYTLYKTAGNVSPAQALLEMGYVEVDDHWLKKETIKDGFVYEQVFDFSDFDYGDTDTYEYYVLRDGVIPSGWTSTISTLDEWLSESLKQLVGKLNEAEMSDEDKHDSDLIRSMIAKMQNRSNAAFTPEEKAIMTKYGISRDNYNKELTVANRTLNPGLDNDTTHFSWSDHNYSNGTPSKINYADRARKLPLRKDNQVAGDGSRVFYQNAHFNRHGKYSGNLQDKERDFQAARMQEPMNDMSMALRRRDSAQRSIDNADADRERRMADAQAAYDKAKKDADWHYDYDTVTSRRYRDGAQAEIDKLLKRTNEDIQPSKVFKVNYDSNGVNSAVMVKANTEEEARQLYNDIKGDKYPKINAITELNSMDAETNTKKGMSTIN